MMDDRISCLLITGPPGIGKSSLLRGAVAPYRAAIGGFFCRRYLRGGECHAFGLCDVAESSDALEAQWQADTRNCFLIVKDGRRVFNAGVFERFGVALLRKSASAPLVLLDEIGGVELTCPIFATMLLNLMQSGVPCIGVLKGTKANESMERNADLPIGYPMVRQAFLDEIQQDARIQILKTEQIDQGIEQEVSRFVSRAMQKGENG